MEPKKNPHQKTIDSLARKLDRAQAKRNAADAECMKIENAIIALGGDPGPGRVGCATVVSSHGQTGGIVAAQVNVSEPSVI